uniref:Myelin basic protein n=1 Tax=Sinocyclocheilus grahami TaxID=75366 RepID=A0A672Q2K7_SINGR
MATASTSGQSPFGLGRKKRAPGLLDQIGRFFGGDKKRKGKGSFRGHLSSSPQRPQHSSTRRRGDVNPVVHFFRSFVRSLMIDPIFKMKSLCSRITYLVCITLDNATSLYNSQASKLKAVPVPFECLKCSLTKSFYLFP